MKISAALAKAGLELNANGVSNSKLDSLVLLAYAISFSKEQIIFNPDFELDSNQQKTFFDLIDRRSKREPVSHIVNQKEFFGKDFFVNSSVLDPRPDSEVLIELVLKKYSDKNKKLQILELGVGSGCLIITLLASYIQASGTAVDISKVALEIAKKNSYKHQVQNRLKLVESDLFHDLEIVEKFDLIISNPPYINSEEIANLEPEVKNYEPRMALDGGKDGLDFYRRIATKAADFLNPDGKIILEIGYNQQEKIIKIFTEKNFLFLESKPDLAGIVRVLCFKI